MLMTPINNHENDNEIVDDTCTKYDVGIYR